MVIIGIILLIVNLVICLMYKKKNKKIIVLGILSIFAFLSTLLGWIDAKFLIMDTAPIQGVDKRIYEGNIIMILSLLAELLICVKLIVNIFKNRKKEEP